MPDEASEMPAKACDQAKKLTLKGKKNTHSILMFLPDHSCGRYLYPSLRSIACSKSSTAVNVGVYACQQTTNIANVRKRSKAVVIRGHSSLIFWKIDTHPPPCTEPYTFVTRYVTLEWPLSVQNMIIRR